MPSENVHISVTVKTRPDRGAAHEQTSNIMDAIRRGLCGCTNVASCAIEVDDISDSDEYPTIPGDGVES